MTENEIVLNLLDFYKSKGLNLDGILDDPMFQRLSLDTKLLAIKKYASVISEGSQKGLNKRDISNIIASMMYDGIGAGVAAYGTAAAAAKLFGNGKVYAPAVVGVGLAGALAGAAIPAIRTAMNIGDRKKFQAQLQTTAKDPSDRNAFHTLAFKNLLNRNPSQPNPKLVKLIERAMDFKANGSEDHVRQMTSEYNEVLGNPRINYRKN